MASISTSTPDASDRGLAFRAPKRSANRLALAWNALGLALLIFAWHWGAAALNSFALPGPIETAQAASRLIQSGDAASALLETGGRVLAGFLLALCIGTLAGIAAGVSAPLRHMIEPLATMLLAVPPIAWIVLAVLWCGPNTLAVLATVVVSLSTVPYLAAQESVRSVDPKLAEMARVFELSTAQRIRHVYLPHMLSRLAPAAETAFGLSWRLTLLAEVVAATSGVGAGLASARSNLDTAESFAWIGLIVALFLSARAGVLTPLQKRLLPRAQPDASSRLPHA